MPSSAHELALIHAAKGGDRDAQTELLALHEGLVRRVAGRMRQHYPRADFDDLCQAGRIAIVFHAVRKFKPELGFTFHTYSRRWVWASMRVEARRARLIRGPEKTVVSLTCRDGHAWDLAAPVAGGDDDLALLDSFKCLSTRRRALLIGHFQDGKSLAEVGRELGMSRQAAQQMLSRIFAAVRVCGSKLFRR